MSLTATSGLRQWCRIMLPITASTDASGRGICSTFPILNSTFLPLSFTLDSPVIASEKSRAITFRAIFAAPSVRNPVPAPTSRTVSLGRTFGRCEDCVPNLVTIEALSEDVPTSRNLSEVLLSFPRHVPRRYNRWNQVNERILRISYRGWRLMAKIDRYRVVARFARLFPDPAIFEDQDHLVERYLVQTGLPREKAIYLYQNEDEIIPVDDSGKPAVALGPASFRFQGKNIVAEFMPNARLALEYYDFGTGLSPEDHARMWKKQRIGQMAFQIRDFTHETRKLNVTNVSELYEIMKKQGQATSLSSIELAKMPEEALQVTVAYLKSQLRKSAGEDALEVEVYAAKDLSASERSSLEKRLTRESTGSTVYVILSKPSQLMKIETQ